MGNWFSWFNGNKSANQAQEVEVTGNNATINLLSDQHVSHMNDIKILLLMLILLILLVVAFVGYTKYKKIRKIKSQRRLIELQRSISALQRV